MGDREYQSHRLQPAEAMTLFRPGDRWAFREGKSGPFREARVLEVRAKAPARVRVEFVRDGDQSWVPTTQLWVPWPHVEEVRASERLWRQVRDQAPSLAESEAASDVLLANFADTFSCYDYRAGVGIVHDAPGLAKLTGLTVDELHDPDGFDEPDGRVVGWSVTSRIARARLRADEAHEARKLLETANAMRRRHVAWLREELGVSPGEPLPDNLRGLRAHVYDADLLEDGLRALLPADYPRLLGDADARAVLSDASTLLREALAEFARGPKALRREDLAQRMRLVLARASRLDSSSPEAYERDLMAPGPAGAPQESV